MQRSQELQIRGLRAAALGMALAAVVSLVVIASQTAQAQTFNLLYTFSVGRQGQYPYAGLASDRKGNLYGTASAGGVQFGTAFELVRHGSGWVFNRLYVFNGNATSDGAVPYGQVVFGPDGTIYGTTYEGGGNASGQCTRGCGTVYNLRPSPSVCKAALCPWSETVLYRFAGGSDGAHPGYGGVVFDGAGNLYGTTTAGGAAGVGTVYKLTPSNGQWTESILYSFAGGSDGATPWSAVALDGAGNLYGTTHDGPGLGCYGKGCGTVYELSPSESGWTEKILYAFQNGDDGAFPTSGLVFDDSGNFYGATGLGGSGKGGTIFQLVPSNGNWVFAVLYSFGSGCCDLLGVINRLTRDAAGSLYGVTQNDPWVGSAFRLRPGGGGWTYTNLHTFLGEPDGEFPSGSVVLDSSGNIYGTAAQDGGDGWGTVWEITP